MLFRFVSLFKRNFVCSVKSDDMLRRFAKGNFATPCGVSRGQEAAPKINKVKQWLNKAKQDHPKKVEAEETKKAKQSAGGKASTRPKK